MKEDSFGSELTALQAVLAALEPLKKSQREFVLRTASDRLQLGVQPASRHNEAVTGTPAPALRGAPSAGSLSSSMDSPKQFLRERRPATEVQRIACLAYYLTHVRNTPEFKTKDLTTLNTEAAGAKFSNAALFVDNATRKSGLLAPASKGNKQITAHGEEVVEKLPDQEGVKAVIASYRPSARRGGKKRSPKLRKRPR